MNAGKTLYFFIPLAVLIFILNANAPDAGCAVPKKNIIKIHYLKKSSLPDLILTYSSWNELSREGFGFEYMRRLRRTWAVSFGYERIHNSLHVDEHISDPDAQTKEDLNYELDQSTVCLEWQIRRKYYGFTVDGGFGIAHLRTLAVHQYDYLNSENLIINEREEGITTNFIMDDRIGLDLYLPSRLKAYSLFIELSFRFSLKNMKNEVRWERGNEAAYYDDLEINYLDAFAEGAFYRAGLKFLF